jgi:hypothetical protein
MARELKCIEKWKKGWGTCKTDGWFAFGSLARGRKGGEIS